MLQQQAGRGALAALRQLGGLQQLASGVREYSNPPAQFALANANVDKAGPGGRSSVSGAVATVFGGNGFLGSYIVNELAKRGTQVVCPFRCAEQEAMPLKQMGDLGQIYQIRDFDIRDDEAIRKAIARSNVIVNCVGMRLETMNWSFNDVHADFPTRLAKIAAEMGHVERIIHFSDMGAAKDHKSKRMSTKAEGDEALLQAFPDATVVRPGAIAGIEDNFYNYLVYEMSFGLFAPVIEGGVNKIQPTFVLDVADAVVAMLKDKSTAGKTFYLGGPEVLTMREMYDLMIHVLRMYKDDTLPMPAWAAKLMYMPMDAVRRLLPAIPTTSPMACADYVEEMLRDCVAPPGSLGYQELNIVPQKVTEGLAIEPVRHYRVGGYRWGDMGTIAKDVPEHIKKYYNLNK